MTLAAKLLIASKKLGGAKMGRTSSITMRSMVGILSRAPAVDDKVWCFFVCFVSCFGMTKFVITKTLWSRISFKTIMVSLHRGLFVVVHRCSSFPIDPKNFSPGANFYQKLPFLTIFWAVSPHLLSQNGKNLAWGCEPGRPSPMPNFAKIG